MSSDQDKKLMSMVRDWESVIKSIAGEYRSTDTKDSWLGRAFDRVKNIYDDNVADRDLTFRHFKDLFYGRVRDPKYSVAHSVLSAADQARLETARRDARQLADTYRSAANALANIDQDFHRGDIDALVNAARVLGAVDRA